MAFLLCTRCGDQSLVYPHCIGFYILGRAVLAVAQLVLGCLVAEAAAGAGLAPVGAGRALILVPAVRARRAGRVLVCGRLARRARYAPFVAGEDTAGVAAGADVLVAGSAIFRSPLGVGSAVAGLRSVGSGESEQR